MRGVSIYFLTLSSSSLESRAGDGAEEDVSGLISGEVVNGSGEEVAAQLPWGQAH